MMLLLVFASFSFYKISLPGAQDLPRQMKNGEMILQGDFRVLTKNVYSVLEPEQAFANHHWLYGVLAYLAHALVGWNGMVLGKVAFLLLTFSLLFFTARQKTNFWYAAVSALPAILLMIGRVALRPEIFSYFFVAVFFYAVLDLEEHPEHRRIFWLIPLELVWVNTHLFFPVGILITAGLLFEKILLLRKQALSSPVVRKLAAVLSGLVLVIFANPFGLQGAVHSLLVNTDGDFPIASAEINSILNVLKDDGGWGNLSAAVFLPFVCVLGLTFLLVVMLRIRQKRPFFSGNILFFFLASLGSALLSFYVIRGLPLFGMVFLLACSTNLQELCSPLIDQIKKRWLHAEAIFHAVSVPVFGLVCFSVIFLGQVKIMQYTEQGVGLANYSEASASFFQRQSLKGPIFNDTDIGSYLIGTLYPQEKVFADNRFGDAYSASFFSDVYFPLLRDEDAWKRGVETYGFNTIFFYHYDAVQGARDFLYRRIYDPDWVWVYADSYAVIFVRNIPENQDVISRFAITSDNVHEKLRPLLDSPFIGERLAGADLLNLVGRVDLSTFEYLRIVSRWPERGKVWMVLGRTELMRADAENSNPALAAIYLERALKEGWKTWESYSYLALAYYRLGDLDRAEDAVEKELRLDPESLDGKEWLGIIAGARKSEYLK